MHSRLKRFKIIYFVALAIVACCMISGSWLLQRSISSNSDEARVINLSGRQRMLSQRLTKAVLALPYETEQAAWQRRIGEIEDAFRAWKRADNGLRHGDPDLGLPARALSPEIQQLFAGIRSHQEAMSSAIDGLLDVLGKTPGSPGEIRQAGAVLLEHEQSFLVGMDAITFQLDKEAHEKLLSLQRIEYMMLAIGLTILAIEFLFVFRPSLSAIQRLMSDLQDSYDEQSIVNNTLEGMLEQTRELAHHASAAAVAKTSFLSTMSHELRTPLSGILGMTDLMLMTDLDDEQKVYASTVKTCSHDLLRMIDDILMFSKIAHGKEEFTPAEFPLRETVQCVIDSIMEKASSKGLGLTMAIEPAVPDMVAGDQEKLGKVIDQLVDNAVKFTEEGQIVVGMALLAETENNVLVRFAVTDTGIGIPREVIPGLFDPFTQGDGSTTRRFSGTGLGLSLCKKMVDMMGGRLGVDSALGHGTTFWFELGFERKAG
ncbi:MAG: hypothetical protein HGA71_17130 [Azonexaceae bacterium]|nr:hypothetical protein [Azonexaceae bacterium]